jgi:hypothetical protein
VFDDYQEPATASDVDKSLPSMVDLVELEADLNQIDETLADLED